MRRALLLLGLGILLSGAEVSGHHSFAGSYFEDQIVSVDGTVEVFEYRNPHSWVYFTAKDATGVVRQYGAEWANPRRLEQQGVTGTSIRLGDHVLVSGSPSHSATVNAVHLKSIRRPADGWSWPTGTGRRR